MTEKSQRPIIAFLTSYPVYVEDYFRIPRHPGAIGIPSLVSVSMPTSLY
jgi:hypothetical protein